MNDRLLARLEAQVAPGHVCTPYSGGCHMPHYWFNHTAPRHLEQWPAPSDARAQADRVREERDWGRFE